MNRGIIKETARRKLGETTTVFWTDDLLNQWAEDAQLDIVWKTQCKKQRSLVTAVADTVRYVLTDLVSNILKILSVRVYDNINDKWRAIDQKTTKYLDKVYPQWQSTVAAPPRQYVYDIELDEFILYPKASSDYIGDPGGDIEIYNVIKPTVMAEDGSEPDLPEMIHPAVIDYIVATGCEARGYQDIAQVQWSAYNNKLKTYMTVTRIEPDGEVVMHAER